MNSFILVWVLVVQPYGSNSTPVFSPQMVDLESCQRLQNNTHRESICVQIRVPK